MVNDILTQEVQSAKTAIFSPGNRPDRVFKALEGGAGIVIADLEDAVPADEKASARQNLATILAELPEGRNGFVVRINEPSSAAGEADLVALQELNRSGQASFAVMVAKTQSPEDVQAVTQALGDGVGVLPLIESAAGALAVEQIAQTRGVVRLAIGAIDLAAELGCEPDSTTAWHVRSRLVVASAAAGLPGPLESPCPEFRDLEVVSAAAAKARRNGLTGILCIHPAQLSAAQEAFAPSAEAIEWAKKVVASADGATALDGQMIDRPVILRAQAILATS